MARGGGGVEDVGMLWLRTIDWEVEKGQVCNEWYLTLISHWLRVERGEG